MQRPAGMSEERPIALTIGTAGHIDHGKTTLVRRMTGTDTDRLEEEHRRGISIVPGYAELTLPSGRRASLVDVPGHERFVRNMVSGATGVDAFLLVVAADDGVMPQTREHMDVLRILGVEQGVVALTKIDAVDEETAALAELDVEEYLESVGIEAPVVRVSGVTGEGVEELLEALDRLVETVRPGRGAEDVARLPVDRAFVLQGIGVVVTGTLWSGEIRVGDVLHTRSGLRPRVRSIQNHGRPAEVARRGARTALNLAGVEISEISAGEVLLSEPHPPTRTIDARIRLLEGARPLRHGVRVRFHHATTSVNARVLLAGRGELAPGESALGRLRLEAPVVAFFGDRFVLRSLAPQITIGGGTVLDPRPRGRRLDEEWLVALEDGDLTRILPAALRRSPGSGLPREEVVELVPVSRGRLRGGEKIEGVVFVGGMYALESDVEEGERRLLRALRERYEGSPESPELSLAEARAATGLRERLADAVVDGLAKAGKVRASESGVSLPEAEVPEEIEEGARRLLSRLREAGVEAPTLEESPELRLLLRRGEAVRIGENMFAAREVARRMIEEIIAFCRESDEVTLAGFRDRMSTSRKYAQAWLEYADGEGVTRRVGDRRVLTRRYRQGLY